jgi:hypothetical protein
MGSKCRQKGSVDGIQVQTEEQIAVSSCMDLGSGLLHLEPSTHRVIDGFNFHLAGFCSVQV